MSNLTYTVYNDKSLAVKGDKNKYHTIIRTLGGRWNSKLKGGEGWTVPIESEENLKKIISELSKSQIVEEMAENSKNLLPEEKLLKKKKYHRECSVEDVLSSDSEDNVEELHNSEQNIEEIDDKEKMENVDNVLVVEQDKPLNPENLTFESSSDNEELNFDHNIKSPKRYLHKKYKCDILKKHFPDYKSFEKNKHNHKRKNKYSSSENSSSEDDNSSQNIKSSVSSSPENSYDSSSDDFPSPSPPKKYKMQSPKKQHKKDVTKKELQNKMKEIERQILKLKMERKR